ncbi:MAG: hypothetical protein WB770_10250 [Acidimicrobiales bacterium]
MSAESETATAPDAGANGCQICEKHEGRGPLVSDLIYADDLVLVYHAKPGRDGAYLGHLDVELRRHVRGLAERSIEEGNTESAMVTRLAKVLEGFGAEAVYSFVFDHIPHHHVHVIARYPGTPHEFWGARVDDWPGAPRGNADAVNEFSARVRAALESSP